MKKTLYVILMLVVVSSCKKKSEPTPPPVRTVPAVEVERKNLVSYEEYPTTIQGVVNNDVRAKISGYIQQVYVDEGQHVNKGQRLFRLETNILSQNASSAQSAIGSADAQIAAAQAGLEAAQVEVDKLVPLVEKDIISPVQLQTAQANLKSAEGRLSQALAAKQQASANYESIKANIGYSVITAPISGVVGSLPLREGSLVGPADPKPLTVISDTKELYAYFSMNEAAYLDFLERTSGNSMSAKIQNMPPVQLVLANGSLYSHEGKIQTVTGQIDPSTGSIKFRAEFPNPEGLLSNGNTGVIRIPEHLDSVLVIPESATVDQQGVIYAYKIIQDTARATVVDIDQRIQNYAVLKNGLGLGDIIAAQGVSSLQNGMPLKGKIVDMDSLVATIKPVFE